MTGRLWLGGGIHRSPQPPPARLNPISDALPARGALALPRSCMQSDSNPTWITATGSHAGFKHDCRQGCLSVGRTDRVSGSRQMGPGPASAACSAIGTLPNQGSSMHARGSGAIPVGRLPVGQAQQFKDVPLGSDSASSSPPRRPALGPVLEQGRHLVRYELCSAVDHTHQPAMQRSGPKHEGLGECLRSSDGCIAPDDMSGTTPRRTAAVKCSCPTPAGE